MLAGEFPAFDEATWRQLVDKALKGAAADSLTRTTADEIRIGPLYTAADASHDAGMPGSAPFVRGASASGSAGGGWDVRQFHHAVDVAATNAAILEDLEGGASSIHLRLIARADAGHRATPCRSAPGCRGRRPRGRRRIRASRNTAPRTGRAGGGRPGAAARRTQRRPVGRRSRRSRARSCVRHRSRRRPGLDDVVHLARRHDPPRRWPSLSRRWRQRGAGAGVRRRHRHRLSARPVLSRDAGDRRRRGRSASRSPRMPTSSSPWPSFAPCAGSGDGCWRSSTHRRRCPRCASMPRLRPGCSRGSTRT